MSSEDVDPMDTPAYINVKKFEKRESRLRMPPHKFSVQKKPHKEVFPKVNKKRPKAVIEVAIS